MNKYAYTGVVKHQGRWKIYGDNTIRYNWALNLEKARADSVVSKRKSTFIIDPKKITSYTNAFAAEIQPDEIRKSPSIRFPSFVVNFDQTLFIDGEDEESMHVPIRKKMPEGWQYRIDSPLFYMPVSISELWLSHQVDSNSNTIFIGIPVRLAAIHLDGNWRFFKGFAEHWILNFPAYINWPHRLEWPANTIYDGDWRKDYPVVNEHNARDYLSRLTQHELSRDQFPKLQYFLQEDESLFLDKFDEEYEDSEIFSQMRQSYLAWEKRYLAVVIDFDRKVFVKNAPDKSRIQENVDPRTLYVPQHWQCHIASTINYIPQELQILWQP